MINKDDLIKFFEAEYSQDCEAEDIKRAISDELKSFAENNDVEAKAIKSAFSLYKRYKAGKNTDKDCKDYVALSGIIEDYFASGD